MNQFVLFVSAVSLPIFVILYVWTGWSLSAVFAKAGHEGWQGWVPVLNVIVLLRLGGFSGWFVLLALVPVFGPIALFVIFIIAAHRINLAFGMGVGMTVLAAVLAPVWSSVLGWGSARWLGDPSTQPGAGPMRSGNAVVSDALFDPFGVQDVATDAPAPGAPAPATAPEFSPVPPPVSPPAPQLVPPAPGVPLASATPRAVVVPEAARGPITQVPGASSSRPAVGVHTVNDTSEMDLDHFDTSAEVSAVAGAPSLGDPRSARSSVSAQHTFAEIPDEDVFDMTILGSRKRVTWSLVPPFGDPILVTADVVIIGRRPAFDTDFAGAQLVPVADETRTVSKTHARLERQAESWVVIDLDSTNGVILIDEGGDEIDATPGVPERLTERFLLGDAPLRMLREGS